MRRTRVAWTVSVIGHAMLLLWGMITFVIKPLEATPMESLAVDVVSDAEFSQITAGVRSAKKTEAPKPLVEKLGDTKPVEELTKTVEKKPEIKTASAEPMPPPPEPRKPDPKPEKSKSEPQKPKAEEKKPDEKKVEEKKPEPAKAETKPEPKADPKPDPIAEALKKAEEQKKQAEEQKKKDEQKKAEEKRKEEQRKKAEEKKRKEEERRKEIAERERQQTFDPSRIAALLDKRDAQRQAATGDTLNQTASLGLPTGRAAMLTQSEIDALRAQIQACWNPPAGAMEGSELIVKVRLMLRQDGSLEADPVLLNRGSHPYFQVAAESALRAIRRCQPYRLPIAKYQIWKDVEVTFDPRDMYRG
ncbi:TolA protein [Rhodovulum sp. PH10]|uniref:cell envelope integrity protein TolA n=1 Tax=Rhodovulum sp. PH10 TaxID=1187851 RepID=UPI00027C1DFB|nr:cell envelope integrity protein TolA [Rhodovulum sp. PH10]EJW12482.1 TolA protein [Rhodovulum sp. PH10]